MLKINIEVDVKNQVYRSWKNTQAQLGEMIGSTGQYVNRIIKKGDGVINKTFVEMLDALGYDIQLTYVKRRRHNQWGIDSPLIQACFSPPPIEVGVISQLIYIVNKEVHMLCQVYSWLKMMKI